MDNEFNYGSILYSRISDRKKGTNNVYQDYNASRSFEDGYSVVALADGLGSCKKSDVGAKIAVETAINFLHEYFSQNSQEDIDFEDLKHILLKRIEREVKKQAIKDGAENIRDYSSTLLFSVIAPNSNEIIFGQIGDGYTIIREKGEDAQVLFKTQDDGIRSTYINNITRTIFDEPEFMHIKTMNKDDIEYFLLTSDGVEDLYAANQEIGRDYVPMVSERADGQYKINNGLVNYINAFSQCLYDYQGFSLHEADRDNVELIYNTLVEGFNADDVTFQLVNPNCEGGENYNLEDILKGLHEYGKYESEYVDDEQDYDQEDELEEWQENELEDEQENELKDEEEYEFENEQDGMQEYELESTQEHKIEDDLENELEEELRYEIEDEIIDELEELGYEQDERKESTIEPIQYSFNISEIPPYGNMGYAILLRDNDMEKTFKSMISSQYGKETYETIMSGRDWKRVKNMDPMLICSLMEVGSRDANGNETVETINQYLDLLEKGSSVSADEIERLPIKIDYDLEEIVESQDYSLKEKLKIIKMVEANKFIAEVKEPKGRSDKKLSGIGLVASMVKEEVSKLVQPKKTRERLPAGKDSSTLENVSGGEKKEGMQQNMEEKQYEQDSRMSKYKLTEQQRMEQEQLMGEYKNYDKNESIQRKNKGDR